MNTPELLPQHQSNEKAGKVSSDHRAVDFLSWSIEEMRTVVLGCGPGIGIEAPRLLAGRGAQVMLGDADQKIATTTQRELATLGDVHVGVVDVTSRSSLREFFAQTVAEVGVPRIVIDIVGRAQPKPVAKVTKEDWDDMLNLNLRQQFLVAHECLPLLTTDGGALTYIGSINGMLSLPRSDPYGAAKAGLASLTRSLAVEYAARRVRVNAVSPSVALTPRAHQFLIDSERLKEFESKIPMGRAARPAEVAVFVSSPLASFVTGRSSASTRRLGEVPIAQ